MANLNYDELSLLMKIVNVSYRILLLLEMI